jgi:ATP-dependent protease ClpP protease subunit
MKIPIRGFIVANDEKEIYEWFGYEVTCPRDVAGWLEKTNGETLEVEINSPGGDVYSGSEIYTALMNYKGKVNVDIVGVAASAASVIAMAGDIVRISPTAQIMIHNVSSRASGDYRSMEHKAEMLKNYNKSIANAYILKSGMEMDDLLELMDTGGTANTGAWLTAQKAKELNLVDEIMFDTGNKLVANAQLDNGMLPQNVIDKMRNLLPDLKNNQAEKEAATTKDAAASKEVVEEIETAVNQDIDKFKARLNLLKLKGEMIND